MTKTLDVKLASLAKNSRDRAFILADAKDADMAFGVCGLGKQADGSWRSIDDFRGQIREIVAQGLVDIMLMSASTAEALSGRERIFDHSGVTPAVRANDSTDIHVVRGGTYASAPSRPFASTTIDHIQTGKSPCTKAEREAGINLGLYSMTFNNLVDYDLATLDAYKAFRLEAEVKGFRHFLEVFKPNVPARVHGLEEEDMAAFINDHIVRLLAGVSTESRPRFLKLPYMGPAALEELCAYDSSLVIGIMGGSAGTTYDAFQLLFEAKKYGARAALFGRKINNSEHQLSFVEHLRLIADDQLTPVDGVKSYHDALRRLNIRPHRSLEKDIEPANPFFAHQPYGAPVPA